MGLGCERRIGQETCRQTDPHASAEPPEFWSNVKADLGRAARGTDSGAVELPGSELRVPFNRFLWPACDEMFVASLVWPGASPSPGDLDGLCHRWLPGRRNGPFPSSLRLQVWQSNERTLRRAEAGRTRFLPASRICLPVHSPIDHLNPACINPQAVTDGLRSRFPARQKRQPALCGLPRHADDESGRNGRWRRLGLRGTSVADTPLCSSGWRPRHRTRHGRRQRQQSGPSRCRTRDCPLVSGFGFRGWELA